MIAAIDLRSDTVTLPTPRMRRAMLDAEVGDDVLGEDPSVHRLEARAAELLGKERGLFVASGTMANQIAAMTLCNRGEEVIVAETSHILNLEVAALAALHGLQLRPVPANRGVFDPGSLKAAIRMSGLQIAATGMVCLENTFDLNRGFAVPANAIRMMATIAHDRAVPVYLDGARLFNAAVALGTTVAELVRPVDAAMFCLSKALSCPIGSVVVGNDAFIAEARRNRQRLGGGWRQAGVIAAAGLIALDEMISRLAEDHARTQRLAELLINAGFPLDPSEIDTNIIRVQLPAGLDAVAFAGAMASEGIKVKVIADDAVRMVVHKDIHDQDLDRVASVATQALQVLASTDWRSPQCPN